MRRVRLLLAQKARSHGDRLFVVTLTEFDLDPSRLLSIKSAICDAGVRVIDLAPEIIEMARTRPGEEMFRPKGHLSAAMNEWVATQVARRLED